MVQGLQFRELCPPLLTDVIACHHEVVSRWPLFLLTSRGCSIQLFNINTEDELPNHTTERRHTAYTPEHVMKPLLEHLDLSVYVPLHVPDPHGSTACSGPSDRCPRT